MTKKISELLQNTPKRTPLKPWAPEPVKTANVKKSVQKPSQNTQYRLEVHFKPENCEIRNGNPIRKWFWNGLFLLEKFELSYNKPFNGELHAIYFKLRQMFGKLERVVIYNKKPDRTADIAFEWTASTGELVNNTKINWKEILQ